MQNKSEDKGSRKYWADLANRIKEPVETKNKRPDTTNIEIEFLKEYLDLKDNLLDLGCGSGLITNQLIPLVKKITAVDKFEGFTNFVNDSVFVINADLSGFKIRAKFDKILCSGVGQCFAKQEMKEIYSNIFDMLSQEGVFISRMHCGINEDVLINNYSEELKSHYFAEYRHIDSEVSLLKETGFSYVKVFDFLPDSINVWDNTRHYYFICKK